MVMHGKKIEAGQLVVVALAAANRDPAVFANPERFDVARTPNKHLGFGVGHHQCLGMNLARMELEAALNQITGVVTNGLFARRGADVLLLGAADGIKTLIKTNS